MNYIKNISISFLYIIGVTIVLTFIMTLLNYFNIITGSVLTITKIIITFIAIFIGGFIIGKKSKTKGWLEGIKLGIIILIILGIINFLILKVNFEFRIILYDIIILFSCTFGSIIGINLNHQK